MSLLHNGDNHEKKIFHSFTLVRIRLLNEKGELFFARPMWLLVFGERREELSLIEVWESYRQRYDVEHFFRFGKQRLLMSAGELVANNCPRVLSTLPGTRHNDENAISLSTLSAPVYDGGKG